MKKQIASCLLGCFAVLFGTSCASVRLIEDRKTGPQSQNIEDYAYTIHVPGIRYTATPLDVDPICRKSGWKDVYMGDNILGGVVATVTLGIVRPQKTEVTCFK